MADLSKEIPWHNPQHNLFLQQKAFWWKCTKYSQKSNGVLLLSLDTQGQTDSTRWGSNQFKLHQSNWFPSLTWTNQPSQTQEDAEDKNLANLTKRLGNDVNEKKQKSTLMIANNTFVKYTKIYLPGLNPISTESNQKVMLSVEQIMLHLPTAMFLHFPLKHLAKASEKASDNQWQDLEINGFWGSPSLTI